MKIPQHPLAWPRGHEKTPSYQRRGGPWRDSLAQARDGLYSEIALWEPSTFVLSTNVEVGKNGLLNARIRTEPWEPGAALYWLSGGKVYAISCDRYDNVAGNLRSISATLEQLRRMKSWGTSAGEVWRNLEYSTARAEPRTEEPPPRQPPPPPRQPPPQPPRCYTELGLRTTATEEEIKAAFRKLAKLRHPDTGGSHNAFINLKIAYQDALKRRGWAKP